MRVRITTESVHGNPGERRTLPVGALCTVVPADNQPTGGYITHWAHPLCEGPAAGWPDDTRAWAESVGVGVNRSEFVPVGALPAYSPGVGVGR